MQSKYFMDQNLLEKQAKESNQEVIHQLNFLSNVVQPLGYDVVVGDRIEASPTKSDAIAMIFGSVLEPCSAALKSNDKILHIFCNSDVFNNSTKKNSSLSLYVDVVSKLLISKDFNLLKGLVFTLNVTSNGTLVRKLLNVQEYKDLVNLCNPKKMFNNIIQVDDIYSNAELGAKLLNTYETSDDIDLKFIVKKINLSFSLLDSSVDIEKVNFFDQAKLIEFLTDIVKEKTDFLQDSSIKNSFIVHAEILASILKLKSEGNISNDIGISKLCCFLCKEYLDFREEKYSGMHNIYFGQSIKSIMQAADYQLFDKKLQNDIVNQLSFFKANQDQKDISTIYNIIDLILKLDEQLDITQISAFKQYKGLPNNKKDDFIKKYFPSFDNLQETVPDELITKIWYILVNISSFANNLSVEILKSNVNAINLMLKDEYSVKDYPDISRKQDFSFSELLIETEPSGLQQEEFKQYEIIGAHNNI